MSAQVVKKVIEIEELRRRHRQRLFGCFGWYVLGYSVILFWIEVVLMIVSWTLFLAEEAFSRPKILGAVGMNVVVSLVLAAERMLERGQRSPERARSFALRFHPVVLLVRIPFLSFTTFRLRLLRDQPSGECEDDGDDDHAA